MDIEERMTNVFRTVFDDETIVLSPELTADDIEAWDSLSHINLIIAVELEFDIEFTQREVLSFENVGDLMAGVTSKLDASG